MSISQSACPSVVLCAAVEIERASPHAAQPMTPPASPPVNRGPASGVRPVLPWALAACFALLAAWLARLYVTRDIAAEQLRMQSALAELALKGAENQLEAERILSREERAQLDLRNLEIAVLASLANDLSNARAVAVYSPARHQGVLALEKLPALPPEGRYELWLIEDKSESAPVSAGVFELPQDNVTRLSFQPTAPVGAIKAFAISREKNDGARAHAKPGEILLRGAIR